jgi:6-phosphogluconolactonase
MTVQIEVVDDPARACAAMMLGVAAGRGHIVLSGGSTPRNAYGAFVHAVHAVGVDVSGATMWFGDERCVAPDDERSNYRMVKESLLDPLDGAATPAVHRMQGELGPHEAADEYERELQTAGPERFDIVLLGIGPDGHCASLFPDQPTLQERSRMVVGVDEAGFEPFVPGSALRSARSRGPSRSCSSRPASPRQGQSRPRSDRTPSPIRTFPPRWWRRWRRKSRCYSIPPRPVAWTTARGRRELGHRR